MNLYSLTLADDFECQLQFAYMIQPLAGTVAMVPKEAEKIQCGRTVVYGGAIDRISHDLAVLAASGRRFAEGTLTFRTLTTEQRYILKDVRITEYIAPTAGLEFFTLESWQVLGPRVSPAGASP
jgi:hypothetical protein